MKSLYLSPNQIITTLLVLILFLFYGCDNDTFQSYDFESDQNKRAVAENGMVSSAHPLASEAGLKMLEKGGNAVDAAVATAFVLNVVEPNMSGVGGGGSMLIWDQDNSAADYVDFYSAKRVETYKDIDHENLEDEFNLLSTGIPGTVAGLLQALEKHGTLTREQVMAPAIKYANEGFPVYLTLAQFINNNEEKLTRYEEAKNLFWPNGEPLSVGEILNQPDLASTLQRISDEGESAFYTGEIAEGLVELMNERGNPVTISDFENYEPQWQKAPLCSTYRDYTVLSAPMPQTGVFIIQALNILENYNLKDLGMPTKSPEAFDILASTLRLSIADRIEFVSDPNWKNIPINGLISKEYAESRRSLVGTGEAPKEINFGNPEAYIESYNQSNCGSFTQSFAGSTSSSKSSGGEKIAGNMDYNITDDDRDQGGETTHISVIDVNGNAASLSTTLSPVFGSGAYKDGVILNTSGYNFIHMADEEEWTGAHPYRVRASTISPTIILEDGGARLAIGAPGGGRIPTAILQNIIYILDYELDPLDAVRMPRIFPSRSNSDVQIERGFSSSVLKETRNMGYDLQALSEGYARMYLVYQKDGQMIGVADPRHDGEPRGF